MSDEKTVPFWIGDTVRIEGSETLWAVDAVAGDVAHLRALNGAQTVAKVTELREAQRPARSRPWEREAEEARQPTKDGHYSHPRPVISVSEPAPGEATLFVNGYAISTWRGRCANDAPAKEYADESARVLGVALDAAPLPEKRKTTPWAEVRDLKLLRQRDEARARVAELANTFEANIIAARREERERCAFMCEEEARQHPGVGLLQGVLQGVAREVRHMKAAAPASTEPDPVLAAVAAAPVVEERAAERLAVTEAKLYEAEAKAARYEKALRGIGYPPATYGLIESAEQRNEMSLRARQALEPNAFPTGPKL